jgi:hypothetical protein
MKRIALILITALVCSFGACTKNNDPGPGNPNIAGKWRWVKSIGGIGGMTLTPKSTGYNYRFEFGTDSIFKDFRNDTLLVQSNYHITKNYKYTPTQTIDLLKIDNSWSPLAYTIRHDTLYFDDLFISDGFNSVYVRIK